jgi:hypothetical protein
MYGVSVHCLGMHDAVLNDMGVNGIRVRSVGVGVPGVGFSSPANFRLCYFTHCNFSLSVRKFCPVICG